MSRSVRNSQQLAASVQRGIPTLGNPVYRTEYVPADRQGAYLGADTQVNVDAGAFNSKKQVAITNEWAQVLNDLVAAGQDNGSGMAFVADIDARITVDPNTGATFVPGSAAQLNSGTALGLALVRNPAVTHGMGAKLRTDRRGNFMRVGGDKYRQLIASALSGATPIPMEQINKLIIQGFMYGLARPFAAMGIMVDTSGRVQGLQNFDETALKAFYDDNLKNPDQRRLGAFAAASVARNFANTGRIVDKRTGQPLDPAALVADYEQSGTVRGKYAWAQGSKSSKERAGLTSHPLRSADGTAVQGAVMDPNAGECNIYGSGPGMGGSGGDEFQLRLYKGKREHRRRSSKAAYGSRAGTDRSIGAPTYYCAPTKAEVIDSTRSVYQPGGSRGGNVGLGTALDAIAQNINRPEVSSQALAARYADWSTDPNRSAPQFQVPTNIPGREGKGGFALFQAPQGVVDPRTGKYIRAPVGRAGGRQASDQYTAQQSNAALPAQYKARGNARQSPAASAAAASFNPFATAQ